MSAIMCHLPDPLEFLAAVGRVTKRAMLFWGRVADEERFAVYYSRPHDALSKIHVFPHGFNDDTTLTKGLLFHGFAAMGFTTIVQIGPKDTWPQLGDHLAFLAIRS